MIDPAVRQEVAHVLRRHSRAVRTIHLIAPREVREAAELARLEEMPAEGQAELPAMDRERRI